MKQNRNLLAGVMLLMLGAGCSQKQADKGYTIKGELNGIDSGMVKLVRSNLDDRTSATLDSVNFSNHSFELKGKVDQPEMMTLMITPGNWSIPVFMENGVITIKADTAGSEHYDYSKYDRGMGANLKNFTVSGSASQDEYSRFQNDPENLKFKAAFADLIKKIKAEKDPDIIEKMRSQFYSVRTLSNVWQLKWINDFVAKNPSSIAGVYIFNDFYTANSQMSLTKMDSLLNKFTGPAKSSVYYSSLAKISKDRHALLPGQIAPDFTLLQRDSTTLTLSSTRGKYMMIDFWASWCHPCREAIPHWKEIYKKYHAKGFDIVSVSDDSRWSDWTKAMDIEKMPWMQVIDEFPVKNMPARVGSLYQTHFIPFYVLLDKEGKILVYSGNEKDIDTKLEEVFKL